MIPDALRATRCAGSHRDSQIGIMAEGAEWGIVVISAGPQARVLLLTSYPL